MASQVSINLKGKELLRPLPVGLPMVELEIAPSPELHFLNDVGVSKSHGANGDTDKARTHENST